MTGMQAMIGLLAETAANNEEAFHWGEAVGEVLSAAIAAVIALIVSRITVRKERDQFFSNVVSNERMNWIKEMRELSVRLFTVCEECPNGSITDAQRKEFLTVRNSILIRLNPEDPNGNPSGSCYPEDKQLIELLKKNINDVRQPQNLGKIRYLLMQILKKEWDKVKVEAGRTVHTERKYRKIQNKIEKDRNNP